MASPREIIEQIRKEEFGIGLQITDSEAEKVIERQNRRLHRALEQLSQDLYSKETHFVLELIQNADDNDYEDGINPLLKFTVDSRKILVQNNERGFAEDNVRALCDVGRTTKLKSFGYIGEKGIGFKSVFRISNEPQIFSNGYQFKFKHKDERNKLGFVVPHWIDEIPDFVDKKLTNIVLPLREEIKFEKIEPILILFLRKLKIIEIRDVSENKINKIIRRDQNGKAEIEHSKGKEYWHLVRQTLKVPENIQEDKREDVKETEVILAFPLKDDGSADTSKEQKIFAYLPTRSYGFKFIIQADFLVPASREDIHKDKAWNKWLCDNNIACVFLRAVEEFKKDEYLKKTYYNYVPLSNEITDPLFLPVANQIHDILRKTECILTESGNWLKPADVFHADEEIRNLISNGDLKSFFGKEYISSELEANYNILRSLGVQRFELDHLLQCLQKTEWLEKQTDKWFIRLYSYLNQKLKEEQFQKLEELRIIRLENGELASISEKSIFFPLDSKGNYGFEKELPIIKRSIFEAKKEETRDAVKEFLKNLGVRDAQPYEIIENHILPIYERDDWRNKDNETLLGYIRYIKDNLESYEKESNERLNSHKRSWEVKENPLARLKKSLYIRINKTINGVNYLYCHPQNIYLPKSYGNENDLEKLFEGIDDIHFLDRCYIDGIIKKHRLSKRKSKKSKKDLREKGKAEIKEWKDFFIKLGVNEGLKIIEVKNQSYLTGEDKLRLRESSWNYSDEETIDYTLTPLQQILERRNEKKANFLATLLEKQWRDLSNYIKLKYRWKYYNWKPPKYTDATWLHLLKTTSWLLTTKGTFAKPSEVFLNKSAIKAILSDSVPYLVIDIKNGDFIRTLDINSEANVEGVLNYLKILIERKCQDISTFTNIYDFLNKHYEGNESIINSAFSNNKIIYIPHTVQGYFTSREVLWKDDEVFGENRGYLEKHYPQLKSFFVDKLGISEKPTPKDYADLLIDLSKKEKIGEKDEKVILKIYEELNYYLDPENNEHLISEEDWWEDFISDRIFWTDKNKFVGDVNRLPSNEITEHGRLIFVNDDQELYEFFKDKGEIAFLKLPKNYNPDKIRYFMEATGGVGWYISEFATSSQEGYMEFDLVIDDAQVEQNLTDQIRKFTPYILRYLYHSRHNSYERLKKNGILSKLKDLTIYGVKNLDMKYTYTYYDEKNFDKECSVSSIRRNAYLQGGNLYVQSGCLEDTNLLAIELSKLFGEVSGLEDFLSLLFEKETDGEIEKFLKIKGIQELPDEEREWLEIKENEIHPAETGALKETEETDEVVEEVEEKEPKAEPKIVEIPHPEVVSEPVQVEPKVGPKIPESQIPEIIHKPQEIEKDGWHHECEPEEAEIHIEEIQISKTKGHKTSDISSDNKSRSTPYDDDEEDENRIQDTLSSDDKKAIGKWGEGYTLECLKKKLKAKYHEGEVEETEDGFTIRLNGQKIVEVHWLNKTEDTGEGYDIEVIENSDEKYIEVKSTKTDTKDWFDISRKQWEFAQEKGDSFHIYRVYNAGAKEEARLVDIQNPTKRWQEGALSAYPVRIQI